MTDNNRLDRSGSNTLSPDEQARTFAMDPGHDVALEASAGTGKTSVLVARYLRLLRGGVDPSNILAITFTRKAAGEMRERIVRELRAAAEQSETGRAMWLGLRDRLGDIDISTIDAFCLSLLREFPLEADLDPGFGVADDTEVARLVEAALDGALRHAATVATAEPDVAMVFAALGVSRLRKGIAHLVERRLVATVALERYLSGASKTPESGSICRAAIKRLKDALGGVDEEFARFLDTGPVNSPGYAMLARDLKRLDEIASGDTGAMRSLLDRLREYFITQKNTPRVRFTAYAEHDYSSEEHRKWHAKKAPALATAVASVLNAFDRDLNGALARGVRRIFAMADEHYRRALETHAVVDFTEAIRRTLNLLQQMDEFAQSRYRLESRYHHVLVDEFQDTSRAQWELVSLLIESWGEGFGLVSDAPLQPSIFIVGDRKQSIYRFRDADVGMFERAATHIERLRPGGKVRRYITRSLRAGPPLLEFINDLFDAVDKVAGRDDAFRYDEVDRFPVEEAPAHADVVLGIAASQDLRTCAQAVASEIARLCADESIRDRNTGLPRRVEPRDIAILFRSRESHREFAVALEQRLIPTYVYKGLGFFDADEIKDVSALMRLLADPGSDIRAAAFMRSRFVRLSDRALAMLAPNLASALTAPETLPVFDRLEDEDRRVLELTRASLRRWLSNIDRLPPADLVDSILAESAYAFEIRGPRLLQARENLKKMRSLVRRIQNRGYATVARIAEHIDRLSAGDEPTAVLDAINAVNLMTVHACKGLEFPIVFIVNIARGAGGAPPPIRVVADRGDGEPSVSIGAYQSDIDEAELARVREETKRLLYVAVTRARERLYLSTVLTTDGRHDPGRGSLAEVLPADVRGVFVQVATASDSTQTVAWPGRRITHLFRICRPDPAHGAGASVSRPLRSAHDDFEKVVVNEVLPRTTATAIAGTGEAQAESAATESVARTRDRLLGTLVHRLFQTGSGVVDREALRRRARLLLRTDEHGATVDADVLVGRAVDAFMALRGRGDVTRLLESGECLYEVPFSMLHASAVVRGTIDCLVRRPDGGVTVVEFKTGNRRPEHERQVDIYRRAARALFPDAPIYTALIYSGT